MRMPFAVGRCGHGLQHSYGTRQALPVLRPRLAGAGDRDDRHHLAPTPHFDQNALDLAGPPARRASDVSPCRRCRRFGTRNIRRVLEPLELADLEFHRPYWKFLWDSNPPTYYSSPSSSGSPSKSSTAAEADAGAVSPFAPIRSVRRRLGPLLLVAALFPASGIHQINGAATSGSGQRPGFARFFWEPSCLKSS